MNSAWGDLGTFKEPIDCLGVLLILSVVGNLLEVAD